ncbi:unnamed protein product [Adineta steineri]|uniref:Potassium channel tetramerisation-type BTB domain-containing protein n=1 Tax=Adineta steineri TaxID=433720 RepID=A0A814DFK9_9BILA|nr:unnamed protein product [Adineta steineri]CAF1191087.1 unnamed protein product [Adineta steineri]
MTKELYVRFKLCDGSVQTILGDMLKPYSDTYLTKLVFNHDFKSTKDGQGLFWIDEEPQIFAAILTFYRHGQLLLPDIFVGIRDSIIDKYLLPIEKSSRVLDPPESTITMNIRRVRLRGATRAFSFPPSMETNRYLCTIVDPMWTDLPESDINDFFVVTSSANGIQYVRKSYLTVMNFLIEQGYEIERWDEKKQEVDLKKVYM